MKTEKEIQKSIKYIKSLYEVDMYQKGRYDALKWVLEGTSSAEKELEAEIEVFINLHDAFININNSMIRHGHTDIFKEYLFDDAISALTKAVTVKENKLREMRAKE